MWARFAPRAASLALPALLIASCDSEKLGITISGSYPPPAPVLSPAEFRTLRVARSEQLTADTRRITLKFPREGDEAGMGVASCVVLKVDVDGKPTMKPYTPVSRPQTRGSIDFIVKAYQTGAAKALCALKEGDAVEVKGPFQKFAYKANEWESIGMIAGGTGITPMYQVLLEVLSNPRDKTEVRLVYASRTEEDIILRHELDALAAVYPNFKVVHVLSKPGESWDGAKGHIDRAILAASLPPPQEGSKTRVLVCGPPGFMKAFSGEKKSPTDQGELSGLLKDMKYAQDQVFKF